MIASISVALAPGEAAAAPAANAGKAEAGQEFGKAVKSVAQEQGERAQGARAEHGRDARKTTAAEEKGASKDDAAATEEDEAGSATDDLLGRLLGGALQTPATVVPQTAVRTAAEPDQTGEEGGDAEDGEGMGERIIISTVADLNNGGAADGQKASIALRVTRMETHFEPHLGTAKLVDAQDANAVASDAAALMASADAAPASDAPIKPAFEEMLQRLGRGEETLVSSPAHGETGEKPADDGHEKKATASARTREGKAESSFDTKTGAIANEAADAKTPTTGQIISSQLAERIIGAFSAEERSTSSAPASSSSTATNGQLLRMTAGGGALKTLSIQLEPQDLGRVDVSMRLIDGRLSVELTASEPSTAQALAGDRHGLRKILEHAGFALDDAAITVTGRDLVQTAGTSASSAGGGRDGQAASGGNAWTGGGERQAGNGEGAPGDRSRQQRSTAPGEASETRAKSPTSSVYL